MAETKEVDYHGRHFIINFYPTLDKHEVFSTPGGYLITFSHCISNMVETILDEFINYRGSDYLSSFIKDRYINLSNDIEGNHFSWDRKSIIKDFIYIINNHCVPELNLDLDNVNDIKKYLGELTTSQLQNILLIEQRKVGQK